MRASFVIFLIAGIILIQSSTSDAITEENKREMIRLMAKNCQEREHATEADMIELVQRNLPTSPTSKCLRACIMESLALIQNGKLSVEASVQIAKAATQNNAKLVQLATDISEECKDITDPNRCELAAKIADCIDIGAHKRGADPRKWN